uniref:tRNA-binding domain-containing protein n=1 Tax=Tetraselmis chuii TaxID=63592 RepID=A0A7S1X8X0_9CHLO|mmetsp:Transcript_41248/g.74153  ORF Transcript_41248/g.74153 Transcript_41248/m.74153 type:complete len:430 (+) Transcript_41248:142-1431(+)
MAAIAINCDAESKQGLQLVAAAAGLSAAASFAPTEGAPTAIASDGKPTRGLNPVARFIAGSTAKGVAANLLGASPEEQAAVSEWLTYCNTELSGVVTDKKLFQVNEHLKTRTFLTLERLTLADLMVFNRLSGPTAALPVAQTDQLCNLIRWFDMIQRSEAAKSLFPVLKITKPRLDTSPLQSVQPTEAAPSKSSSSTSTKEAQAPAAGKAGKGGDRKSDATSAGATPAAVAAATKAAAEGEAAAGGKAKKEKKEKKEKPAPPPAEEASVRMADIRVGTITKVWRHPNAEALYCEEIDLGEDKPRTVVSGLVKFVPEDQMLNRRVVVVCNLKPAKMRDVMSYGMVLCAANEAHDHVEPLAPPEGVPNGERVVFEGFEGEPEEVLNPKKKVWEKISPDLVTDASGVAKYKQAAFMTTKGPCTSKLANGSVN